MKKLFCILLGIFIIYTVGRTVYSRKDVYFYPGYHNKYESFKTLYYTSQYVKKIDPSIIPDNILESFAGGIFLKGLNPILIVHDQPPLGRYIISLSILLFDNANTLTLFLQFFSILGIYLIAKLVLKNSLFSLLTLAVFVSEPIFNTKFSFTPLLETIQLPFIVFTIYFFIKGNLEKKYTKWFVLCSLMLGFVISIRFFSLGVILLGSMISYLVLNRHFNRKTVIYFLTLPISLVVLIASYTRTILDGYTILQIFGIQKYILVYHKSQLILLFSVWDLLLFNRWHTWWGDRSISSDSDWMITWPIATLVTFIGLLFSAIRKIHLSESEKIISLWVGFYLLFLSGGTTSVRYFLPLIPFLYILTMSFILKVAQRGGPKFKKFIQ